MANENVVLTKEGREKLEEELYYLENEKRAEVGERIKVAREFGDISENSEYDDAKNEQAQLEQRISEINRILSSAIVVSNSKRSTKVNIGTKVTVEMSGTERVLTIVGSAESNSSEGKISNDSPVGAALIGHKKGEEVVAIGPTGRRIELKILKVEQ